MINNLHFLMLEDLSYKSEGLFRIIASEVVDLQENMFVVKG